MTENHRHRVVIIGAGFGGLNAARALRKAPVDVTVINATNHHIFEPLIYQVAAGVLSPGEVAVPIREALRHQKNTEVLVGWATDIDAEGRTVTAAGPDGTRYQVPYDTLVLAAGATQSYFGHDGYGQWAPSLKTMDDALEIRARIFGAFEEAELATDPRQVQRLLTFVIVGAGPTGVEMAGQIAEIAHRTLPGRYRRIDPRTARVVLIDAVDRVLPTFDARLSQHVLEKLRKIGVEVRLGEKVVDLDETGVKVESAQGTERIEALTKIWAAGVAGTTLARRLAASVGAETDRAGRILVGPDLTVPGHPEIFVLGEAMSLRDLPGVAQVAMQGGTYAGRTVARRLTGRSTTKPFSYFDKGNMAAVSRFYAIADLGPVRLTGLIGWLGWLAVHLFYLPRMRNRVTVLLRWAVSFLGRGRSEAVITSQQVLARDALRHAPEAQREVAAPTTESSSSLS
ncbi:NAD(P)/FAD-dependent oxidoreductase [Winogradskya consettensis]|uniref:NADH:ubiquinone reductase (non-electrogenic) n=1 Tax=Winogradskya consettensis TaxID=113560 RepID=A0A919VU30_9ACTN|nr:NAD(P)/FAD-dependent oxidoreductase [Actinoplanes consettensis]GIM75370.1 putative NADH dehydrogenase (NDH) [Actinoplanes consettensis]